MSDWVYPAATFEVPRQRILTAAVAALSQLDMAALAIQRICASADVTPPTIYHHFGNKEGLIVAAVEHLVTGWIDQFEGSISDSESFDEMLDQSAQRWHAMITSPERPIAVFVWVSMWSEGSRSLLVGARGQARSMIHDAIATHVGVVPGGDEFAGMTLDAILGAAVDYHLDTDSEALERRLATLTSVIRFVSTIRP